jgi:amino acid transporter
MIYSLIITTVLYILIALVLTGMVSYTKLDVGDFLARAFNDRGLTWLGGAIALSALVATTSVLLVFQLGQPRIWMSMSRDGLLPPKFGEVHPKYHTPSFSTIITGLLVGIPALFLDSDFVTDLTSIGTLFAFVLVSGGILLLPRAKKKPGSFSIPYINGKYIIPGLMILTVVLLTYFNPGWLDRLFTLKDPSYPDFSPLEVFVEKIPYFAFIILMIFVGIYSYLRSWSVIPVIGLLSSAYLLTELGATNWIRFIVWLIIGLVIYFSYGVKNSRLKDLNEAGTAG